MTKIDILYKKKPKKELKLVPCSSFYPWFSSNFSIGFHKLFFFYDGYYVTCGVWELGATTSWIFSVDEEKGGRLLVVESISP